MSRCSEEAVGAAVGRGGRGGILLGRMMQAADVSKPLVKACEGLPLVDALRVWYYGIRSRNSK